MSKEKLLQGLNDDLAGELGTIIRYNYQASKIFGAKDAEVRNILRGEIGDEMGHAVFLSDVIVDLGGEPTITPKPFEKTADVKKMLELNVETEQGDAENYMAHSRLAEELGEADLKVKLEEIAADEAGHARVLTRLLRGM